MSWIKTLRTSAEDLGTLAENEPPTLSVTFIKEFHWPQLCLIRQTSSLELAVHTEFLSSVALSKTVASCCASSSRKPFMRREYTNIWHLCTLHSSSWCIGSNSDLSIPFSCSRISSIIAMTFRVSVTDIRTGSKSSAFHICLDFLISCSLSVNPHNTSSP